MSGSESTGKILPLGGKALPASQESRAIEPASNEALSPEAQAPGEKTGFDPSSSFFPPQLPGGGVDGKRKRRLFVWAGVALLLLAIALGYAYLAMQGRNGMAKKDGAIEQVSTPVEPKAPAASGPVETGTIRAANPQPRAGAGAATPQQTTSAKPAPSPNASVPGGSRTRPAPAKPVVPRVTHTRPTAASSAASAEQQAPQPLPQPDTQVCSPQAAVLGLCERPATNEPSLGESER